MIGKEKILFRFLSLCITFSFICECSGRKVLGHFDQLTIGSEFLELKSIASKERIKTESCDKVFLNAFQVGIYSAKTNVIREALRKEMERDSSIVAFTDIHFQHEDGCWKIEYTPERRSK